LFVIASSFGVCLWRRDASRCERLETWGAYIVQGASSSFTHLSLSLIAHWCLFASVAPQCVCVCVRHPGSNQVGGWG
jgi:hypothetical protein